MIAIISIAPIALLNFISLPVYIRFYPLFDNLLPTLVDSAILARLDSNSGSFQPSDEDSFFVPVHKPFCGSSKFSNLFLHVGLRGSHNGYRYANADNCTSGQKMLPIDGSLQWKQMAPMDNQGGIYKS
jgi:hypothetical protein